MSLVEKILPYERDLFLWLNEHHTSYWDNFMSLYSGKLVWLPLVLVSLFVFVYKTKWKEAAVLLCCAVLVGLLCDYFSAEVIKPFFSRLRPTHHVDFKDFVTVVDGYRGGRYGFISNHAANGFGIVVFTSLLFRNRYFTLTMLLWATITAYSRIYLGVHFISDVVAGAIWGALMGALSYYIYIACRRYILKVPQEDLKTPVYSVFRSRLIMFTIFLIVLFIAVYSVF